MGVAVCNSQQHLIHVDLQQASISPACLVSTATASAFGQRHIHPQASGRHDSPSGMAVAPCGVGAHLDEALVATHVGVGVQVLLEVKIQKLKHKEQAALCMYDLDQPACRLFSCLLTLTEQAGLLLMVANTCEGRHTSQH